MEDILMNMQIQRYPNGDIKRIIDLSEVVDVEVSDSGLEIKLTLRNGKEIHFFEAAAHHDVTVQDVMESLATKFKSIENSHNAETAK